jgi:GntR family transcriptional regulator
MTRKRGRPKANGLALHHRLYMMLQQQLADGTIPPGGALPSEPDLAHKTHLSRTTVRRALARLAAEGMIERRHGSGTYATAQGAARAKAAAGTDVAGLLSDLRAMARVTTSRELQNALIATPPRVLAACPELGARVLLLQRARAHRGKTFVVINHYIVERYAPHFTKNRLKGQLTVFVFEKSGLVPSVGNQQITAIAADHVLSRELGLNIGAPVLAIRRSVRNSKGALLEYHEAYYDPDSITVQMEVHREKVGRDSTRWRPVS